MNKPIRHLTPALLVLAAFSGSLCVVARAQDTTARPPAPTLDRFKADSDRQRWLLKTP